MKTPVALLSLTCLLAIGCMSEQAPPSPKNLETEVQTNDDSSAVSFPAERQSVAGATEHSYAEERSLCEVFNAANLAGDFRVESIVSNWEEDPFGGEFETAVTRVTFEGSVWKGAEKSPITVLMKGGLKPDGTETGVAHDFQLDEQMVLFLEGKWPNGEWAINSEQIFDLRPHGGFANLFVLGTEPYSIADIKSRVLASPCEDVAPDSVLTADSRGDAGAGEGSRDVELEVTDD